MITAKLYQTFQSFQTFQTFQTFQSFQTLQYLRLTARWPLKFSKGKRYKTLIFYLINLMDLQKICLTKQKCSFSAKKLLKLQSRKTTKENRCNFQIPSQTLDQKQTANSRVLLKMIRLLRNATFEPFGSFDYSPKRVKH